MHITIKFLIRSLATTLGGLCLTHTMSAAQSAPDYAGVHALFIKHECFDCHGTQEPDAKLVLETFDAFMKGGQSGPSIVPGNASDSTLVKFLEGRSGVEGKNQFMPPGKRERMKPDEIALIRAWIDAGAPAPAAPMVVKETTVPRIEPKVPPRRAIKDIVYEPKSRLLAVARYGEVEIYSAENQGLLRTLTGHRGSVTALAFSKDGRFLFAAAGEPALFGEVRQWRVSDWKLVRTFEGHSDSLFSVAVSPDGKILATGSYDQLIKLWHVSNGEEIRTIRGHNGCVFGLAFRPDGKLLASASADRTVKLWEVATGERRDTLSQSLKELYTVTFSADGKHLLAGGVDNRIRLWDISAEARETTNPLLESRFAHERPILKLVHSADGKSLLSAAEDGTVKIWDTAELKERRVLEPQPDWPAGVTFALDGKAVVVGRLDGTLAFYDATSGKVLPPPKPALESVQPRGIQRGKPAQLKLTGTNLVNISEVKFHHPKLTGKLLNDSENPSRELRVEVSAAADLPRGAYELSLVNAGGESGRLKIYVDDLPHEYETAASSIQLPAVFWGALAQRGEQDEVLFEAKAGQRLVFDLSSDSIGSKLKKGVLTLLDPRGKPVANNAGFNGGSEPLLTANIPADGQYRLQIRDLMLEGSHDHFYRLTAGELPYVTGFYPLGAAANAETKLEMLGYNLPTERQLAVKTQAPGLMDLPLDREQFRTRGNLKLLVSDESEQLESEPNDIPQQAASLSVPGVMNGRIWTRDGEAQDVDLFRFEARAGGTYVIQTDAARRGSPVDTKIEILHENGDPVLNRLLQAVRDSWVNFRSINSDSSDVRVDNWEEMDLNQFLYFQGEVCKIYRMPQGPDSGFRFYTAGGKRRSYFNSSPTAHALDEPCYVVEPHPPGAKLVANGLPVFPLYFANDDDGERKLGIDSRLLFTAPTNGQYVVRVTDSRGFHGELFAYRLTVREAKPDFTITMQGAKPTVPAGNGNGFSFLVDRIDGFDGEIRIDISGLPPGFIASTPVIVEADHLETQGVLFAATDAPPPTKENWGNSKITATATIGGQTVVKELSNFGQIKLGAKPKLLLALHPSRKDAPIINASTMSEPLPEIILAPGQTVPAWLSVVRNGETNLVSLDVDGLPHGVIVDNIGLNGVQIRAGENEREIFLSAAKWVPETERLCHAVLNSARSAASSANKQCSFPVRLKIRRAEPQVIAAAP